MASDHLAREQAVKQTERRRLIVRDAWSVFRRKPISEAEIKHEMERQAGQH